MNKMAVVRALVKKVERQSGDTAEEKLCFAIFQSAANDLLDSDATVNRSAARYMRGNILHLELLGIDADWVRGLFKKAGVDHLYT